MNECHHVRLLDELNQTLSISYLTEASCTHLNQENSKTEDVHFRRLQSSSFSFRCSIYRITRSPSPNPLKQVDRAVVRDFGPPAVARARLQQNIGTADVTKDDGGRMHLVEVCS